MDQLECRRRQLRGWIRMQGNLIYSFMSAQRVGDTSPFLGSPCRPSIDRLGRETRSRMCDKFADVRLELGDVGRLQISPIGAQHCMKAVRGGENDLCDRLTAFDDQSGRKQVLQFMCELTQLPESAGRRIALERVHGATHAR